MLDQNELMRYSRHFPVIGMDGQEKLKKARVLCIGVGGLGCPALQYLAAAGVGTLGMMDGDQVELSNLQRQVLFNEHDIGKNKATLAGQKLQAMNQALTIDVYPESFSSTYSFLINQYDIVLDATDNYETRYALNDYCRHDKKPLVYGSLYQYDGQISVFNYQDGPCYQCLYPDPPSPHLTPTCATGGVLCVLPGIVGTLQAAEVIKIILGLETLSGILLCVNALSMQFSRFEIKKQHCIQHPAITIPTVPIKTISPITLSHYLQSKTDLQLIDVREAEERSTSHIGGLHIPLAHLEANLMHLDKMAFTVIYCKHGARSATACQLLINKGFHNVHYLQGGMVNWLSTVPT